MKNKKIYFTVVGIIILCAVALVAIPVVRKVVSEKKEGGDYVSNICKQLHSESPSVFVMEDRNNVVGGYYVVAGKSGVKDLSLYLFNAQGTQIAYTGTADSAEQKANFLKTYNEFNSTYKAKKEVRCQK